MQTLYGTFWLLAGSVNLRDSLTLMSQTSRRIFMYKRESERKRVVQRKTERDIKMREAWDGHKKRQTAYPCFTLPVAHIYRITGDIQAP